jgi:hypothetical protein
MYPATGSTLKSSISTSLSTQILVKVDNETVGAIQSLEINHSRTLERIKELGTDGVLEIVPKEATTYSISVRRIVFDRLRLPEAFARGFINIKAQMLPFDIQVIDRTGGDGDGAVTHTFHNCWFNSYKPSYGADNFILSETADLWCEDVSTTLGSNSTSAARGGDRGINQNTVVHEQDTDTSAGGLRGSMDVSGLNEIIKAAFGEK